MASGEGRKVSRQDIQLVQNLIERCLQLYMSQKEVVNTLLHQAKIEPGFTELVWQKLEEENQEFFRAYRLRLLVKDQIVRFNELLERQVELMRQICNSPVVPSISMSNVSLMPSMRQNFAQEHVGPTLNAENLQAPLNSGIPNLYTNGASSLQPCINMPTHHPRRIDDVSPNNMLLAQTSNMGMMHGLNGGMMKSETHYSSNNSGFMFGSDNNNNNNVLNTRPTIGDTSVSVSVSSFSTVESSSQPLNGGTILDPEESSFGFLGQIPRNFSLSDLTADFSNSSDILGSYSRSPFLETGNNNFLDPNDRGDQQDMKRLDTISENLSYEDFTSD